MRTVAEILKDPEYINANLATKQEVFRQKLGNDPDFLKANQATQAAVMQAWGLAPAEPAKPPPKAGFSAADTAISLGQGVVGVGKSIADVFGADTAASKSLAETQESLAGMMSPERKAELAYERQQEEAAAKEGTMAEMKVIAQNILSSPIQSTAQAIGSIVPNLLSLLIPGVGEARAAIAARTIFNVVLGAAEGTGAVKGSIYDNVSRELVKTGMKPEEAAAIAADAQSYTSDNLAQIGLGTLIGAVTGRYGVEQLISGAGRGAVGKLATVGGEAVTEGIQGGQEQLAANLALQKQGINVDTMKGVAGAATREGLMGVLGAGITVPFTPGQAPAVPPTPPEAAPTAAAPEGPPLLPMPAPEGRGQIPQLTGPEERLALPAPEAAQPKEYPAVPESYGDAVQEFETLKTQKRTPEVQARLAELAEYRKRFVIEEINRAQPSTDPELVALREQILSGKIGLEDAIPMAESMMPQPAMEEAPPADLPTTYEDLGIAPQTEEALAAKQEAETTANLIEKDRKKLQAEQNKLKKPIKGKSLFTSLRGIVEQKDLNDADKDWRNGASALSVSEESRKNGIKGKFIGDLAYSGQLDDFLPPDLRSTSETVDDLSRAKEAEEYIKEKIAERNWLTWEANDEIAKINQTLEQLNEAYNEYMGEADVNNLIQEAVNEQRAIDSEAEIATPETEAGSIEVPEGTFEEIPSEEGLTAPTQEDIIAQQARIDNARKQQQRATEEQAALTEEERKRIAQASEGAAADFELGQTPMDNLTGQKNIFGREDLSQTTKKHLFSPSKEQQQLESELDGLTFMQMADWAVKNAQNAFDKHFAQKARQRIVELQRLGYKFDFEVLTGNMRPPGMYDATGVTSFDYDKKTVKIRLNGAAVLQNQRGYPSGMEYETVLHELLHAATRAQFVYMKNSPYIKAMSDLRQKVVEYYNAEYKAGRATPFMEEIFKQENNFLTGDSRAALDEFLSWGISSREAQKLMSEVKVGEKTGFSKLVELIRNILGINKEFETALDRLIRHTNEMLLEDISTIEAELNAAGIATTKPGGQESLFQKVGKESPKKEPSGFKKAAEAAAGKAKEAARKAGQKRQAMDRGAFKGVPEDLINKINNTFFPENKTIVDKIEGMRDNFWKKVAQGVADQYRSIKDYTEEGYMLARLSKTIDGALEGLLFNGQVTLKDGALDIKQNTKGLMQALEPVGEEVDRYQVWVAANRDARLPENKRSIDKDIVQNRATLAEGTLNGKSRLEVYQSVQKEMNALNRSVLDIARKQGLIDEDAYERFSNDIFYIPFYKAMEDGDLQGASTASGLTSQYFSKELKGGERPFGDLMENTLRNWSHILSASMKNQAAKVTMDAAMKLDAAFPNLKPGLNWEDGKVYSSKTNELVGDGSLKPEYTKAGKNMVKIMMDGREAYFEVIDPMLLESIMSIGYMGPKSKFLNVAKDFKNLLQFGVTISPAFKVRNLFRDSIQSMAVSDMKLNPFTNVIRGWTLSDRNNAAHISALAGGAIFNFGSQFEGDQSALIKKLLKAGVKSENILDTQGKIKAGLANTWRMYQDLGNKSEAANRMSLYQQMVDKGMTHLEASFYARDLLDFSMQGAWPAFRLVTQVVPFLNARIQGLYKLGKDGIAPTSRVIYNTVTGKPIETTDKKKAQQFSIVTGSVVMASMMLYLAFKDDEEFKKREDWDRDNFWWMRLPGMDAAVRVPKPFEIGAFGTLAERTLEQIIDKGAEGKQFETSIKHMLSDTFALNPTPQMIKPLVDLYANKDSFTGAPIETAGMERLSKAERASDTTSPLGIALSAMQRKLAPESMEMSPAQVDYAIKSYFGWLGGTITQTSHYAVMPFSQSAYPDTKMTDTLSMGFIKELPSTQSKYVTAFYENSKQISQAYADMRHYAELGKSEKVQQIIEEKGDLIAMEKFYDKTAKDMAKIRKAISVIRNDTEMGGDQKKEEIDRLKMLIGIVAEQAESARKSVKESMK